MFLSFGIIAFQSKTCAIPTMMTAYCKYKQTCLDAQIKVKSKSEQNKRKQRENPSAKLRKAFIQSGNVNACLCEYKTDSKASLSIDERHCIQYYYFIQSESGDNRVRTMNETIIKQLLESFESNLLKLCCFGVPRNAIHTPFRAFGWFREFKPFYPSSKLGKQIIRKTLCVVKVKQIAFWVKIQLGSLRDIQRDDIQIKPIIAGAFTRFCCSF